MAFSERIPLSNKFKDGLEYKNVFTGSEAVELIAYIIKTQDLNLARLLGRALDAQKFFHDVTYAHRLRNSPNELYQFNDNMIEGTGAEANVTPHIAEEVNGVFTLMTECYSPTCTPFRLCYSIACPRRLEQQARLNLKVQPVLKRQDSRSSLHEEPDKEAKLWINTVSTEVAASVTDKEKKRQEIISELAYTERDFVKDLEYLRDFWIKPLRHSPASPIPENRREKFVRTVFSNCHDVYSVNSRLAEALTLRQQKSPIVEGVGDILLEFIPQFSPFIQYGANQLFGKMEFENEKRNNPAFQQFVDETERLKESRKLELNGYLTKPTTRLARYPLLLQGILKATADGNPDKENIPKAIEKIKEFLSKVNIESGKAENRYNLMQLHEDLKFRPGEHVDLKLTHPSRQMLFKSALKRSPAETTGDIMAYLFDHAVVLARSKTVNKREELKVYRRPIPLELLSVPQMDEMVRKRELGKRPSSGLTTSSSATKVIPTILKTDATKPPAPAITFRHLGKGGYELTLYCISEFQQRKWLESIDAQQQALRDRSSFYTTQVISKHYFAQNNKVTCGVPIDGGTKLLVGTDLGVFLVERSPRTPNNYRPHQVLNCKAVTQIDVLEYHGMVLLLTDKTLYAYPLDALEVEDGKTHAVNRKGRKICHANHFKAGICQGQQLVSCVKPSTLSSTIRVYEPTDQRASAQRSGVAKILGGAHQDNSLILKKELYIPAESTSIHHLRSKLCVGTTRGFELVNIDSTETQTLLNQADTSLDFVQGKENIKPIHIERIGSQFLLCYSDYSFFVKGNGWRARPEWLITWEGNPVSFAIFNQYILAFEPSFIEIRHLETGMIMSVITHRNIRMLHSSNREILYAYEDENGCDVITSINFWKRSQSPAPPKSQPSANSTA